MRGKNGSWLLPARIVGSVGSQSPVREAGWRRGGRRCLVGTELWAVVVLTGRCVFDTLGSIDECECSYRW